MNSSNPTPAATPEGGPDWWTTEEEPGDETLALGVVRSNLWAFEGMRRPLTPGRALLWVIESLITARANLQMEQEDLETAVLALEKIAGERSFDMEELEAATQTRTDETPEQIVARETLRKLRELGSA